MTGRLPAWSVFAALAVAIVALAAVIALTVSREAGSRHQLLAATYRGMAELAAARVTDELAATERAMRDALARALTWPELVAALDEVERTHAWVRPIVLLPAQRAEVAPDPASAFERQLLTAERAEQRSPATAVVEFERALGLAATSRDRTRALNGLARTTLKAGQLARAGALYERLLAGADLFDATEARYGAIARNQLIDIAGKSGDGDRDVSRGLNLLEHAVRLGLVLDTDSAAFYRGLALSLVEAPGADITESERMRLDDLTTRSEAISAVEAALRGPDTGDRWIVTHAGASARIAAVVRPDALIGFVGATLGGPDGTSQVAFAVVDAAGQTTSGLADEGTSLVDETSVALPGSPGWRIAAYPLGSSLELEADRDVRRYALWLGLVFVVVVGAMALAVRSVQREIALARMRAEFVSSVSHELRTPLSLIRMFAESLREGWVGDGQKAEYYDVITRESERLTGLIGNVLDFSRVESGTRTYQFIVTDVRQVVGDLLDRYQPHLQAARVDLVRNLPDGSLQACIDREAFEQTLVNLLSNAVKYMGGPDHTPRTVTVSLASIDGHVELCVADTGIGMTDEQRRHIFERFYRADDEAVRAVPGSGLGLALVDAHVRAHAGTIEVDSAPGKGSAFRVGLPLATEGAEA